MSLPQAYNPRFIQYYRENARPDFQTLGDYGISIMKASAEGGVFRVIGIHHLSGKENGGNHHVFIDVLDEVGHRIEGAEIRIQPEGGIPTYAKVDKPANEPGTNAPLWGGQQYRVAVANHASDTVIGLHTGHPDEPGGGNTWGHHSFYIVFQWIEGADLPDEPVEQPPIDVTPVEPPVNDQALKLIVDSLVSLDVRIGRIEEALERVESRQQAGEKRVKQLAAVLQ